MSKKIDWNGSADNWMKDKYNPNPYYGISDNNSLYSNNNANTSNGDWNSNADNWLANNKPKKANPNILNTNDEFIKNEAKTDLNQAQWDLAHPNHFSVKYRKFMDKLLLNNPAGKFMQNMAKGGIQTLFGDNSVQAPSTGNNTVDKAAQFAGNIAAFGVNPGNVGGGMAEGSLNQGANILGNTVGKPISNATEKVLSSNAVKGLSPAAQKVLNIGTDYAGNALKTGTEFAGINAGQAALQGGSNSQIFKSGLEGAGQGALFGTGFKAAGDLIPKGFSKLANLKKGEVKAEIPTETVKETPLDILKKSTNKNVALNQGTTSTSNTMKVPYIKGQFSPFDETQAPTQHVVSSSKNGLKNNLLHPLQAWDKFYTRAFDINHPLKAVDENTYIKATNAKNTGAIVNSVMNEGLVNRQGKKIGVSLKQLINENVPQNNKEGFWEYVLQKHNIDRAKEITDDEGKIVKKSTPIYSRTINGKEVPLTSEQSAQRASYLERQHPEWKAKADNITGWIDKFMNEWGVNSGIIDSDLYNNLRETYKNYVPTQRDFKDLESVMPQMNGRGFIDQNIPLKKVQGSTRDIKDPAENIMNLVNRTIRTAKYNEVGQDLLSAIRQNPTGMSKHAEIIPEGTETNPNVNNVVTVLENGKKVNVQINDKSLLNTLNQVNKYAPGDIQRLAKAVTNPYKALITTKNPLFAARNIARDIPTAYINGSESNPIKFTKNLLSAGKDLLTNNETAQQYHGVGGGGSNFLYSGDNAAKAVKNLTKNPNIFQRLNNGIEKINDITESAPRLAEYKNVLKKTGNINKALYAANDITTNFSRGGDITKKVDSFVPYLNAGFQGLDKVARQFKDKPLQTTAKGIAGITLPTLIFNAINSNNPNYKQLDNRTKDNYFLIPTGDKFIKIPKSRELGVLFGSLAERTLRSANGEQNAFKGFGGLQGTVATNIAPSNPATNNLVSPLLYNIPKNKDFADRTIVPQAMQDRSGKYQYDETTSEIAKRIGQLTNLSPKQIDYVIKSYTGVLGQMGLPMAVKRNYQGNAANIFMKPITTNFTADPLYSNQTVNDFYDNYDKAQQKYADYKFTNGAEGDTKDELSAANTGFMNVSKAMTYYSKLAQQASLNGNNDLARKYRAQMIQLALNANNGQFLTSKDLKELEE